MEIVKLRNGSEEPKPIVVATILSLKSLMETKPITFYELVMKCRDRNHQLFGVSSQDLKALRLIGEDESVHESIRNIVLSSAEGDGLDMKFVSPIAA